MSVRQGRDGPRQGDLKRRTARRGANAKVSAIGFHGPFGDRQAEPRTARRRRPLRGRSIETIENSTLLMLGNARTAVAHFNDGGGGVVPELHAHLTALWRVLDRVVDAIHD